MLDTLLNLGCFFICNKPNLWYQQFYIQIQMLHIFVCFSPYNLQYWLKTIITSDVIILTESMPVQKEWSSIMFVAILFMRMHT